MCVSATLPVECAPLLREEFRVTKLKPTLARRHAYLKHYTSGLWRLASGLASAPLWLGGETSESWVHTRAVSTATALRSPIPVGSNLNLIDVVAIDVIGN